MEKIPFFENRRRKFHFCRREIDYTTSASAFFCRREMIWVRKTAINDQNTKWKKSVILDSLFDSSGDIKRGKSTFPLTQQTLSYDIFTTSHWQLNRKQRPSQLMFNQYSYAILKHGYWQLPFQKKSMRFAKRPHAVQKITRKAIATWLAIVREDLINLQLSYNKVMEIESNIKLVDKKKI